MVDVSLERVASVFRWSLAARAERSAACHHVPRSSFNRLDSHPSNQLIAPFFLGTVAGAVELSRLIVDAVSTSPAGTEMSRPVRFTLIGPGT
jgi:hypothetical protein